MLGLFKKTKLKTDQKRDPVRYDKEKDIAKSDDVAKRMTLAKSSKTHQEILYYLAEKDPEAEVRKAVAENAATPLQATEILAKDDDEDVRMALAGRLVDLLPELDTDKHSQLYAFAVQALSTLALDEVLTIRRALSSTLKDHAHTPPKVAGQLARDIEREVSEPILRFCTVLSDEDLLDILKEHPGGWAIEAIAARPQVSAPVSEAVIETEHVPAGAILLENEGAMITEVLLENIIDRARSIPEWQGSIAGRKNLPPEMAKTLAGFVDGQVRDLLAGRADFDPETRDEIAEVVRRRIDFEAEAKAWIEAGNTAIQRVSKLDSDGRLNAQSISDALAMGDREFVLAALAHILKANVPTISKVFEMKTPKGIVALCWKAQLSMRMALQLQKELGHIQPDELIYPKDGSDYPMSEEDLRFQLEFLGLEAA